MKLYLDNNLVCAITQDDQVGESAALTEILDAHDAGHIEIVTSRVTKDEIDKCPEPYKTKHARTYSLLTKVPFVDAQELKGFNTQFDQYGGTSSPRIDDDPIWVELRNIGLDSTDAHHVMLAIKSGCDVFLTCDKCTILRWREQIQKMFQTIKLLKPSEFVSSELLNGQ